MIKKSSLFALCAAITLSLPAMSAFAQTPHSRPNLGTDKTTDQSKDNALEYTTSWIGNSYGGENLSSDQTLYHVPIDMDAIYVSPDGTVFSNNVWDEGGRSVAVFSKNGTLVSKEPVNTGWQGFGGVAVAAADNFVFKSSSPGGSGISILNVKDLTDTGLGSTLPGNITSSSGIFGMTVAKGKLYVTENDANLVEIFDIKTLTLVHSFPVQNPVRIAVDLDGGMWVSHRDTTMPPPFAITGNQGLATVDHYSSTGAWVNSVVLPDDAEVVALAVNSLDALLVADDGPDQNIKIYGNLQHTPFLVGTFGVKGGNYAGPVPGQVGPLRFRGMTGIGTDAEGNIYVSQSGFGLDMGVGHGLILQSYSWWGGLNWERDGLEFVSLAGLDPHSDADAYDAYHHFKIDYAKSNRVDTYVADTYNRFKYPDDLRISSIASQGEIKYIHGKKFLLVRGQIETAFEIYRFEGDSEIAIPCVAFDYGAFQGGQDFVVQPTNGEWIWRDVNGDGQMSTTFGGLTYDPAEFFEPTTEGTYQGSPIPEEHRDGASFWMDDNGDIWQVNYATNTPPYEPSIHLRRYLFQGFDQFGAPIYDFNHMTIYNVGAGQDIPDLASIGQAAFFPKASKGGTLYVMGSGPTPSTNYIARYDGWDTGSRKATWVINTPVDSDPNNPWSPESFATAGDFVFLDFNTPHYNLVYSAINGQYVGRFAPGSKVGGLPNVGNSDESHSNFAFQRESNGEYVLIQEEDYQGKLLVYRWFAPDVLPVPPVPQPPLNAVGVSDDEAADLSWTGGPDALTYSVSRSTTSGGPYTVVDAGIYQTSVSDVGLTNGQTYYYVVNAVSDTGATSANTPEIKVNVAALGTTYEAELAVLTPPAFTIYGGCDNLCSNNGFVAAAGGGSTITFNSVNVATAGTYAVRIYDINGQSAQDWGLPATDIGPTINVTVNGAAAIVSPQMGITDPNWNAPGYVTVPLSLNAGNNTIVLSSASDQGEPNIDRILVPFAPMTSN